MPLGVIGHDIGPRLLHLGALTFGGRVLFRSLQRAVVVVAPLEEWLNQPVTKLLLLGPPHRLADIAAAIRREFLHQVTIVQTEGYLLQVTHATASKSQALRVVAGELGVTREQVMAIGDNANDVGMLQWAGIGVAMGNASKEVLAVADHVTDHHDADGAANAIQKLILSGLPKKRK